jgi:hypothetical protein
MSWDNALKQLDKTGVVEFGIHQMNEKIGSPKWRRHKGGSQTRFQSVRAALFSPDKGAKVACLGKSSYARDRYSKDDSSVVPYVAAWLKGEPLAFLARAGATAPEVTLVPSEGIASIVAENHANLLSQLAKLFGEGAEIHGVRHLGEASVLVV